MKKAGIFIILTVIVNQLLAQSESDNWRVNAGLGITDLLHFGVHRQVSKHNAIGIEIGSVFLGSENWLITLDHEYYFGKSVKKDKLETWYLGQRLNYLYERDLYNEWQTVYANLAIGRYFNLTRRFGIKFDLGVFLLIKQFHKELEPSIVIGDTPAVLPNARMQFFYRF